MAKRLPQLTDIAAYSEWLRVQRELESKLHGVRVQTAALEHRLQQPESLQNAGPVARALALQPGQHAAPQKKVDEIKDQLSVLFRQEETLLRAVQDHQRVQGLVHTRAGTELFGHYGAAYMQAAHRLQALVAQLMEANGALLAERDRLGEVGIGGESIPDIVFPDYGLHEQLPMWAEQLGEKVEVIEKLVQQASAAEVRAAA